MSFLPRSFVCLRWITALLTFVWLLQTCVSFTLPFNRTLCQLPTSPDPLSGCPTGTLLVSPSPSSPSNSTSETFATLQSALNTIPSNSSSSSPRSEHVILILPGVYTEQVNITHRIPLTILGQTLSPDDASANTVTLLWHAATAGVTNSTLDNAYTSTLIIAPTLLSSLTGSGPLGYPVPPDTPFGSPRISIYNVDIANDYAPTSSGPSLAVAVSRANAGFYFSKISSYQDTVYIGKLGNAYFYEGEVSGMTDFLYGFGTLWVQGGRIALRGCGGGISAWKGVNRTTEEIKGEKEESRFGVYVHGARVERANATLDLDGQCSLGRPWNSLHRSIFAKCELDASIRKEGYSTWSSAETRVGNETFMAEYGNYGPGYNESGRSDGGISRVLTKEEYLPYAIPAGVFRFENGGFGNTGWIDNFYAPMPDD
ncbi:carbohydrate esterase family 8 protein [Aulographum hederae CBS 113979]|uniref:pectinesterase n=1 Tax=Aulographum hederae CBS 113979 TaxID=1176131 RepID=A0A6G1H1S0_9PEZI|nr:carbohydrate esterase family 8 protein [Aulographum hederae CBS 113979]